MKSVHQQGIYGILYFVYNLLDYTGNANVDSKSLIVDTDSFIKDLKSTHFTVNYIPKIIYTFIVG